MIAPPMLSVVIPAFNEEARLDDTIAQVVSELESIGLTWEILIVNDGSVDATGDVALRWSRREPRVRLLDRPHVGKGAAVRAGMLAAAGEWRFLADADLSMPIAQLRRFVDVPASASAAPISVGSREANGARRINEPFSRHAIGRVFNVLAQALVVDGIGDTQCGFKLFSRHAAETLFPLQRLNGFGFDVEVLALAQRAGFGVREVPIDWRWVPASKVTVRTGAAAFADLVRIKWNLVRGVYGDLTRHRADNARAELAPHGSADA
jgi:glycosyltransferase involved in cell wall biosynthesis